MKDPSSGSNRGIFFLQIIFPNSEKVKEINGFENHEYLRYVELDTDVEHQKRVILRAMVNPDALSLVNDYFINNQIDDKEWKIIISYGKRTFVKDSVLSKEKGAGY